MMLKDSTITVEKLGRLLPEMICRLSARSAVNMPRSRAKPLRAFSAGVTDYRSGERIEDALERADQALYEAKRTGKNRTCVG